MAPPPLVSALVIVAVAPAAAFHAQALRGPGRVVPRRSLGPEAPATCLAPSVALRRLGGRGVRYSSEDWLAAILSLPRSRVLRRISFHLVSTMAFCAGVVAADARGISCLRMAALPHSLLAGFLGLLLVFRTNSAYARYWEGRQVWGHVMNAARNLAQLAAVHVRPCSPTLASRLANLTAAFPLALADRCLGRGPEDLSIRVRSAVPASTPSQACSLLCLEMRRVLATVMTADPSTSGRGDPPRGVASQDLLSLMVGPGLELTAMARHVDALVSALGACERLLRTPVPIVYSRHTSRFLTVWCSTLPLTLVGPLGLAAVPVCAVVCWALFGIEEIGHLIEQPFIRSSEEELQRLAARRAAAAPSEFDQLATSLYGYGLPVEVIAATIAEEVDMITAAAADTDG